jgi:hypothetical protein
LDFGIWDGERDGRPHSPTADWTPVVEVRECLPNPEQVWAEDRFVLKRLDLDPLLFLNFTKPVGLLGGRPVRPFQEV